MLIKICLNSKVDQTRLRLAYKFYFLSGNMVGSSCFVLALSALLSGESLAKTDFIGLDFLLQFIEVNGFVDSITVSCYFGKISKVFLTYIELCSFLLEYFGHKAF